ncbi:MAG: hypothetical protein ACI83W_000301 [Marinoscillum sp.]|jgi:hypothetical protein
MGWIDKLQTRWELKNTLQVILVLIAFACTGFTVLSLKRPIVAYFTADGEQGILFSIIYYILIFPIYNLILLIYGFILGQFTFFWEFEKKTFRRLTGKKK